MITDCIINSEQGSDVSLSKKKNFSIYKFFLPNSLSLLQYFRLFNLCFSLKSCFNPEILSVRISSWYQNHSTMVASASTMVASNSTTASSSTSSSSSVNLINQPLLLLSNMANMMTVKLDNTNYIVWKHQISIVLETYSLFELLDEPQLIPNKFLEDLSGNFTSILNLDFLIWKSKEKALLTFTSSTFSTSILALTVGCTFAMEVWKVLENRFSSISRSHIMNLKGELHNLKKRADFVDLYLQRKSKL